MPRVRICADCDLGEVRDYDVRAGFSERVSLPIPIASDHEANWQTRSGRAKPGRLPWS